MPAKRRRLQWTPRSTKKRVSRTFFFNSSLPRLAYLTIRKVHSMYLLLYVIYVIVLLFVKVLEQRVWDAI